MKHYFSKKIDEKSLKIGIVGLGYVGLPLAVESAKAGFETLGFDVQKEKVDLVNQGKNYIKDIDDEELKALVQKKTLATTTDFSAIAKMDFIAICVPTPINDKREPDLSFVKDSVRAISGHLKKETVIVLESTTYPGTTEELLKPMIEEISGLKCDTDFYLGYSPERIDPGNAVYKTNNTPKVVGGTTPEATEIISHIYREILESEIHIVSSPTVAEMEKLLENTYRNINMALINEMAQLCHKMNISIWEVVDAAKTKPYGFQAFYPGPGIGGHCIPIDPYYLSWKALDYDFSTTMINSSMSINNEMPRYCYNRIGAFLESNEKSLNDAKVLVLGVAYKEDIDDMRESPALEVIHLLKETAASVDFYDSYVPEYMDHGTLVKGLPELSEEIIASYDLVVITTAHKNVDYEMIATHANLIFDTRNALAGVKNRSHIAVL